MMRRLRARLLFASPEHVLSPGELVLGSDGRVLALRRCRGPVPDVALLPGLVDAHAHLQLEPLAAPRRAFVPWVRAVMAQRQRTEAAPAATAAAMLQRLLASGTTAVGEIDSTGASPQVLRAHGVSGRCYQELTGFHLDRRGALQLLAQRAARGSRDCPAGLSPHAPYSVSAALFAAAARASRHLQVHCAETREEVEFLARGSGPFRDLLERLGRLPRGFRAPRTTAVALLQRHGLLRRGTALVHCQHLDAGDAARIAASGAAIVVCPGTIDWFDRPPPPVAAWLDAGIPVALGTDSHASNRDFSMLAELARAARQWPMLAPATLLAMATTHGARALGRPGLGALRPGGRADLFAVPAGTSSPPQLLERLVHGERRVAAVWLAGRRLAPAPAAVPAC